MLELKLKHSIIALDFSFFASLAIMMLTKENSIGIIALAACGFHELSHLVVMIILGVSVDRITFYGAGIRISSTEIEYAKPPVKIPVLLAGSFGNFLGAIMLWTAGFKTAALINIFTGVFNLLPIGEFDGALLLKMLLIHRASPDKIDMLLRIAGIITGVICIFVIIFFGGASLSLISTLLYIFTISVINV